MRLYEITMTCGSQVIEDVESKVTHTERVSGGITFLVCRAASYMIFQQRPFASFGWTNAVIKGFANAFDRDDIRARLESVGISCVVTEDELVIEAINT